MRAKPGLVCLLGVLLIGLLSLGQPLAIAREPSTSRSALPAAEAAEVEFSAYLPLIRRDVHAPRVNVPHFAVADIGLDHYDEMAIFWLGRVTPTENYADVRVAYSDTKLELRLAIFDRLLWTDVDPLPSDLEDWDAVTVYLDLNSNTGGAPDQAAYRFVAQLSTYNNNRINWQTAYRGNGTGWAPADVPFSTYSPWRGVGTSNTSDDRGWEAIFEIPFASIGLADPPAPGTLWGLSVAVHDRDDSAGNAIADQRWPEMSNATQPATWGELHFGQPSYSPPPATNTKTIVIREGVAGTDVVDAAIGGTVENLCPGGNQIWSEWGNTNYGASKGLNIQNQRDVADWPCFSKYYVKFPLNVIPQGHSIVSATFTLYHWGNSGDPNPGQGNSALPSFIHVLMAPSNWTETALTWNNDPEPMENVAQGWVPVVAGCSPPCIPRNWDVSQAVASAYATGGPISFAVYSSDSAYHSGKFFSSSDVSDGAAAARPSLSVTWGDP